MINNLNGEFINEVSLIAMAGVIGEVDSTRFVPETPINECLGL